MILVYLLVGLPCLVIAQMCHHTPGPLTHQSRAHSERHERTTRSRILATNSRMKFHVEFQESVLEHLEAQTIKGVVWEVVDRVSRTLSVKQEPGHFLFETNCEKPHRTVRRKGNEYCTIGSCRSALCGEITVPDTLSQPCYDCDDEGVNCTVSGGPLDDREPVHFTLFVGSFNTSCEASYIAYAYACRIDDITDRPVAGVINLCPTGLNLDRRQLLDTVQHEMFHALGFSSSMYGLYRDAEGLPLTPREDNGLPALDQRTFQFVWSDRVIQNFTLEWEHLNGTTERQIQAFVLPNVLREARAHFGCPSLPGVELEDGGGFGTSMSHFEKRILATESMNGILTPVRVFSRISLALMEDTGWYIPDYDLADDLNWGKGLGCDFVQKSCLHWIDDKLSSGQPPSPWCTNRLQKGCHAEGLDVAYCNINTYSKPIAEIFQLSTLIDGFDQADLSKIGGNRLTDYCPFYEVLTRETRTQTDVGRFCTNMEIVDECRYNNCTNGGVCRDVIYGYYCDCTDGYAGRFCDHVNAPCSEDSGCQTNEVCRSTQCECERDRPRDEMDKCLGVTDVTEYSVSIRIAKVNGRPVYYSPSLLGTEGESIRRGIELEVRILLENDPILRAALSKVVTRGMAGRNINVDLGLIFRANSTSSNVTLDLIASAMARGTGVLRESGTAYTVIMNASLVRDANECEDEAGHACSRFARCLNTMGSYDCECLPGYEDDNRTGVLPGRECTDVDECISSPCQNGGQCTSLANRYRCECPLGYSGERCENELLNCRKDSECGEWRVCSDEGHCICRHHYKQTGDGKCDVSYRYEMSLTVTSLDGLPIAYTSALTNVRSQEYNELASTLRSLLMFKLPIVQEIEEISFRNGSVIATFKAIIGMNTTASDLRDLVHLDLGDGLIGSGLNSLGVYPDTLIVMDFNECSQAADNDCSPDAKCVNVIGSYTCSCMHGFEEESLAVDGPGRVCVPQGQLPFVFIALCVGLVFAAFIFLILLFYCRVRFMRKKSTGQESPHPQPHHHQLHHLPRYLTKNESMPSANSKNRNIPHPYKTGDGRHPERDVPREQSFALGQREQSRLSRILYEDMQTSGCYHHRYSNCHAAHMDSPFLPTGQGHYMPASDNHSRHPSRSHSASRHPVSHTVMSSRKNSQDYPKIYTNKPCLRTRDYQ